MKITLNANEGRKVLDALANVALAYGWEEDELKESGVLEEYASAVDAAVQAMGLTLEINSDDEEEEEEGYFWDDVPEYDMEDEDDRDTPVYVLTMKGKFIVHFMNAGYSFDEAVETANILFGEGNGE